MMMDNVFRRGAMIAACAVAAACGGSDSSPTATTHTPTPVVAPQQSSVRPGTMLQYRVLNAGGGTVTYKPCVVAAQQLVSTGWKDISPLPAEWQDCTASSRHLAAGISEVVPVIVPLSFLSGGIYRVALDMTADDGSGPQSVLIYSTSFTVASRS